MLAKRIVPCLDVKEGKVVKGVQFNNHCIVGDILERANYYCQAGADELVFYDITASCEQRTAHHDWIKQTARFLTVPFCVAGGIRSIADAGALLNEGADKISINSPALECPALITELARVFGSQCIVIGIDSLKVGDEYRVYQYTGNSKTMHCTQRLTLDWIKEVQDRGAGEIVLNCMGEDGMRNGYDVKQLKIMRPHVNVPLIASGGAGCMQDFLHVFEHAQVDGALAASVFHSNELAIVDLKKYLSSNNIEVRP